MGKKYSPKFKPQQDAGWGLIFRINDLWKDVERLAPAGNYKDWNFKLDRIWCNLLYRNKVVVDKDEDGNIIAIKLPQDDVEEKDFLDKQILNAKVGMNQATQKNKDGEETLDKKKYLIAKQRYYNSLMIKDVWLRKFMQKLDLYLKEIEYDPSKAIYGG